MCRSNRAALFALGLVLGVVSGASAKDCGAEIAIPDGLAAVAKELAEDAALPQELKPLAGAWIGAWEGRGADALCSGILVGVYNGTPTALYLWGAYSNWNVKPGSSLVQARVRDGELQLINRQSGLPLALYKPKGADLAGTYGPQARTFGTFRRVEAIPVVK